MESMKEKQAFIFFLSDSPFEWETNQEIFLFYLNRISVNEDDECEVILVEDVEYLGIWETYYWSDEDLDDEEQRNHKNRAIENNESSIDSALYSYEIEVKKGFGEIKICTGEFRY